MGRTKYPIKRLKNQKKKKIKFKIKNDANRNIADLIVSLRWIFSIKELFSQRIRFLKNEIEQENSRLKIVNNKIDNLVKMTPNLNRFISFNYYNFKDSENISLATKRNLGNFYYGIIFFVVCLVIVNLFLAFSNPFLTELMFLMIFICFVFYDDLEKYKNFVIICFCLFCLKDVLYFFFFLNNDYAQMLKNYSFGNIIIRINKFLFPISFVLKVIVNILFFVSFQ